MIVKGRARNNPVQLAEYLLRTDDHEHVSILSTDYGPILSLKEAFMDMDAMASITKGKNSLYHAQISPEAKYPMTKAQWIEAANILEKELSLSDQMRVIVLHSKDNRTHAHCVWARTDIENGVLVSDSMNYQAHERASAEMERRFGHDVIPGVHAKRDMSQSRPVAAFTFEEWQAANRKGVDIKAQKATITALYEQSCSGSEFQEELRKAGYILARGDQRNLVLIDEYGDVLSLSRQLKGYRKRQIQEKLTDLDQNILLDVEQGKLMMQNRQLVRFPARQDRKRKMRYCFYASDTGYLNGRKEKVANDTATMVYTPILV